MNPYQDLSDEKLMELYQSGESMAFEVLYYRHKNKVFGYLSSRLKDSSQVQEVFQNAFMKFHKSRNNYDSRYPLLSWLFTVTRTELIDFSKKRKLDTSPFDEQSYSQPEEASVDGIDLSQVSELKAQEKEAIERRYLSDQDYSEISRQMNVSSANARKLVSRGLAKLRKKFSGGESE